jgi:hypothetical protein
MINEQAEGLLYLSICISPNNQPKQSTQTRQVPLHREQRSCQTKTCAHGKHSDRRDDAQRRKLKF